MARGGPGRQVRRVGAEAVPRRVPQHRRCPGARRRQLGGVHQLPGRRPRRPGVEHLRHPWHGLYYGANYARLQRVKSAYDPRDVFHHALSIRPA
ncbi:BBE domain-containing protein [Streptomyces erythrogriseus]